MSDYYSVALTANQWRALLRAADNGAWSGDHELLETMFPRKRDRKSFVTAMRAIQTRIGADYSLPKSEDL